jgi:hypothetical protein
VRYSAETTASVTEIMQRARQWFGPEGAGLRQSSVSMLEATYTGELGSVDISVRPMSGGINEVVIASQSFDAEAANFARDLPRQSLFAHVRRTIRSKIAPRTRP